MIEQELHDFLTDNAGIAALVGSGSPLVFRIHPLNLPENPVYPAITYQLISWPVSHVIEDGHTSFAQPRWQISAWAQGIGGYKPAKQLADAIRAAFDSLAGPLVANGQVQRAYVVDLHDAFESTPRVYMCPVDVILQYNP